MSMMDNIKKLEDGEVILVISKPEKILDSCLDTVKQLSKDHTGIYVSINKPSKVILKHLEDKKISSNNLYFIETYPNEVRDKIKNCVVIDSPANLTEISLAIKQFSNSIPPEAKKYAIIDSLSTLLVYNSKQTLLKFAHFLINEFELNNVKGVFFTTNSKDDQELSNNLKQFVTKTVKA